MCFFSVAIPVEASITNDVKLCSRRVRPSMGARAELHCVVRVLAGKNNKMAWPFSYDLKGQVSNKDK